MSSISLRRLASDQFSLRRNPLPPNYLFPTDQDHGSMPDDLTQLTILLTGPQDTPYSQGLWRLHLRMPEDYPQSPPKASFKTRIWHPNVEESTGSICVDTLKRDWHQKLTLRDVLITISCLLIQPNPDSALNAAAGSLLQDDYEDFARQARVMTSIHAPIPGTMKDLVWEAKSRGDDRPSKTLSGNDVRLFAPRQSSSKQSVVMMKDTPPPSEQSKSIEITEEEASDRPKENDPPPSLPLVVPAPPIVRSSALGKRPLSALPTPIDPEMAKLNIAANSDAGNMVEYGTSEPLRKSPKLSDRSQHLDPAASQSIYSDVTTSDSIMANRGTESENAKTDKAKSLLVDKSIPRPITLETRPFRKTSTPSSSWARSARVGIRRL